MAYFKNTDSIKATVKAAIIDGWEVEGKVPSWCTDKTLAGAYGFECITMHSPDYDEAITIVPDADGKPEFRVHRASRTTIKTTARAARALVKLQAFSDLGHDEKLTRLVAMATAYFINRGHGPTRDELARRLGTTPGVVARLCNESDDRAQEWGLWDLVDRIGLQVGFRLSPTKKMLAALAAPVACPWLDSPIGVSPTMQVMVRIFSRQIEGRK